MRRALDPACHRILGRRLSGRDVFACGAELVAGARDTLRRRGAVATLVAEVTVVRHVVGVRARRLGQCAVPAQRTRRLEGFVPAFARYGARIVDQRENFASRRFRRIGDRRRKRRREYHQQSPRIMVDADVGHRGIEQFGAILPLQTKKPFVFGVAAANRDIARTRGPVARLLDARRGRAALGNRGGGALKFRPDRQRRQPHRTCACRAASAQRVDRGVKIGCRSLRAGRKEDQRGT